MNDFEKEGLEFKREMLRKALNKCKPKNITMFNRMYGDIEAIPENKMTQAYTQVMNTREKLKAEDENNGKLQCGCVPDKSGFGNCSKCVSQLRQKIYRNLTPKQKAFDRYMER